jgi:hypothetical protein
VKRSRRIQLVLLGGLSLAGCDLSSKQRRAEGSWYTNNHQVTGLGYYHAPYRAWYSTPYNFFDPQRKLYFHGGQWSAQPHASITNISTPYVPPPAPYVSRSGFGRTSRSYSTWG